MTPDISFSRRILFILLFPLLSFGQNKFEKLEKDVAEAKTDSLKAAALNGLAWEYAKTDPGKGIGYSEESIEICNRNEYRKLKSSCYNTSAYLYELKGELEEAEKFYKLSIAEKKAVKDFKGLATVYSNISKIYRRKGMYDEGLNYLRLAIPIMDSLKNYYGLGLAYNNTATILKDIGQQSESLENHKKALEYRIKAKDTTGMAYSYVNIGAGMMDQGDYRKGLEYQLKGLKMLETTNDYPARVLTLANMANVYERIKNYKEAARYNKLALELAEKYKVGSSMAQILQLDGQMKASSSRYKEALEVYERAYKYSLEHKQVFLQTEILGNTGACHLAMKHYPKALDYLGRSAALAREHGIKSTEFKVLCKLSDLYVKTNKYAAAIKSLDRAKKLAKSLDSKREYLAYYKSAIKLHKAQKDKDALIGAYDSYFLYRDSVMPEHIVASMTEAGVKYGTEKKQEHIELLRQKSKIRNLELKEQKLLVQRRNVILYGLILFALIIAAYTWFIFRKEKAIAHEKRLLAIKETEEQERSRIAKDIHDDLGSGLSKIRFLTEGLDRNLEAEQFDRKVQAVNTTAYHLVENMRDMIWALNPENNTLENLFIRMREYISDYFEEFAIETRVKIPENVPHIRISNESSRNLFSVVKEALQNVVKHAEATALDFSITLVGDELHISIRDNGKGFSISAPPSGNGLRNMRSRMERSGGSIDFLNGQGSEVKLNISLEKIGS